MRLFFVESLAAQLTRGSRKRFKDLQCPRCSKVLTEGTPLDRLVLIALMLVVLRQVAAAVRKVLNPNLAEEIIGDLVRGRADSWEEGEWRAHEVRDEAFVGQVLTAFAFDDIEQLLGCAIGANERCRREAHDDRVLGRPQHLLEHTKHQHARRVLTDLGAGCDQVMEFIHEDDLIAEGVAIRLILFVAVFIAVRLPRPIAPAASVAIGALEDRVDPVPIAARHSATSLCVRESTQRSRRALFVVEEFLADATAHQPTSLKLKVAAHFVELAFALEKVSISVREAVVEQLHVEVAADSRRWE